MALDPIPARLKAQAVESGYWLDYRPTRYRRGWPEDSSKPFQLWINNRSGGSFLACFATLDQLERNWRGRAGC